MHLEFYKCALSGSEDSEAKIEENGMACFHEFHVALCTLKERFQDARNSFVAAKDAGTDCGETSILTGRCILFCILVNADDPFID